MRVLAELAKFLTKYCEENGLGEVIATAIAIVLLLVGLGVVIGWFVGQRGALANLYKTIAESKKVDAETRNELAKLMASVDEKRLALREQRKQMALFLKDVLKAVESNRTRGLRSIRNDVCEVNSNEYMPALNDYLDDCVLLLPKKIGASRIAGEIIPSLRQQQKLFTMLNHDHFFDNLRVAGRYELDRNASDSIFAAMRNCTPIYHFKTRKSIRELQRDFKQFTK